MTHKSRKRLFLSFVILFFISVPALVLFTQGYRVDFDNFRLVKTGGIDLDIKNIGAGVFVDGKFKKENNFIFSSVVFRNILPGSYHIKIEKDQYIPWEKTVEVGPEKVSRYLNIHLFPQNISPKVLAQEIKQEIYISPDNKWALVQVPESENILGLPTDQILLINLESGSQQNVLTFQSQDGVQDIQWSSNSAVFSITLQKSVRNNLLYTGSVNNPSVLLDWGPLLVDNFPVVFSPNSKAIPSNNGRFLFILETGRDSTLSIHRINFEEKTIRPDVVNNILSVDILNSFAYYFDEDGILQKTNLITESTNELSPTGITRPDTSDARIIVREDEKALIVINQGDVFLWKEENASLIRIAVDMNGGQWSQDKNKLMYWNENEIIVYWLKDVFGPPQRSTAERDTITEFRGIKNVKWGTASGSHILIQTLNGLIFFELDERDKRNIAEYNIKTSDTVFTINTKVQDIYTQINGDLVALSYK